MRHIGAYPTWSQTDGGAVRPRNAPSNVSIPTNVLIEAFDGNRFIESNPLESFPPTQAVDILVLWEKAWYASWNQSQSPPPPPPTYTPLLSSSHRFCTLGCRDLTRTASGDSTASSAVRHWVAVCHPTQSSKQTTAAAAPSTPLPPPPPPPPLPPLPPPPPTVPVQEHTPSRNFLPWNGLLRSPSVTSEPINTLRPPHPQQVTPEQQAQILQELPGIGTWAGRQRLFSIRPAPAVKAMMTSGGGGGQGRSGGGSSDGDSGRGDRGSVDERRPPTLEEASLLAAASASIEREGEGLGDNDDTGRRRSATMNGVAPLPHQKQMKEEERFATIAELNSAVAAAAAVADGERGGERASDRPAYAHATTLQQQQQQQTPHPLLHRSDSNASSEARHLHEAWRYRFTRKWEAEQKRAAEADPTASVPVGDLDALEYLQACGIGVDLHLMNESTSNGRRRRRRTTGGTGAGTDTTKARRGSLTTTGGLNKTPLVNRPKSGIIATPPPLHPSEALVPLPLPPTATTPTPLGRAGSSVSTITMQFEVEPSYMSAENLLANEDSGYIDSSGLLSTPPGSGAIGSNPGAAEATRDLLSVAVRGRELLARQKELETEAVARWQEIQGSTGAAGHWAGAVLAPVDIPMSGRFCFVVIKVVEPGSAAKQKFLVRGKEGASPQELLEDAVRRATVVCKDQAMPFVAMSVVGTGVGEWRRDTDGHVVLLPPPKSLHRRQKSMVAGGSPPDTSHTDACGLAASLLRQSLPCHYLVSAKSECGGGAFGNGSTLH